MVPGGGGRGRMEVGERQFFPPQVPSTAWGAGSCGRWRCEREIYLVPFIKPPAAERPSAMGAASTATPSPVSGGNLTPGQRKKTGEERTWAVHEGDADREAQYHTAWTRQLRWLCNPVSCPARMAWCAWEWQGPHR